MPRLYVDANPSCVAYVLDGGGSGYQELGTGYTSMQAEYMAVIYGLNQYFLKWNSELDARQYDMTRESKEAAERSGESEFFKVSTPSQDTPRPLPPPVLVCISNEGIVAVLSTGFQSFTSRLRKLAQQIQQMTKNVDVKFEYVPRSANLAHTEVLRRLR